MRTRAHAHAQANAQAHAQAHAHAHALALALAHVTHALDRMHARKLTFFAVKLRRPPPFT